MRMWTVLPDGNKFRSFHIIEPSLNKVIDTKHRFRSGGPLGKDWKPMWVQLYEEEGEKEKPVGHFPSVGGSTPLTISQRALEVVSPLVRRNAEVLDLITTPPLGVFYALNVFFADCLDHSKSEFAHFEDGRVMDVKRYAFRPGCLEGKHLLRIPEVWSYLFADDVFKQAVERNGLEGLMFYPVPEVDATAT